MSVEITPPPPADGRPVFILGSGRSGNTLLRRVIIASRQIYIPMETFVIGEIIRNWPRMSLLRWRERVWLFCAFFEKHHHFPTFDLPNLNEFAERARILPKDERTLRRLFEAFYVFMAEKAGYETRRWGDKTPYNTVALTPILKTFPDAQCLHIYRDGLDVVASYVKAGLYETAPAAAQRWVDANAACERAAAKDPKRFKAVRYEDFVAEPERVAADLFAWLGLTFDPAVLTTVPERMGDVGKCAHHSNVVQQISPTSVGRWRNVLTPDDLAAFPPAFWRRMEAWGYQAKP